MTLDLRTYAHHVRSQVGSGAKAKSKDHTANLDDHKCSIPTNRNGAILIEG